MQLFYTSSESRLKEEKIESGKENIHNLKNVVKGILWFCNKMPGKKPNGPNWFLVSSWKVYLQIMVDNAVDKLIRRSLEKDLINHKKDLNMTFVNNHVIAKTDLGGVLSLPDGYRK